MRYNCKAFDMEGSPNGMALVLPRDELGAITGSSRDENKICFMYMYYYKRMEIYIQDIQTT